MNLIVVLLFLLILLISTYKFIVKRSKQSAYIKAGKKWDEIVNELRRRK